MNILLRARYVATDLVTSQNFQPIRCAYTLFHFGRTRDVYVATRIILLWYFLLNPLTVFGERRLLICRKQSVSKKCQIYETIQVQKLSLELFFQCSRYNVSSV